MSFRHGRGRTDANHREVRDGLRAFGASVADTSAAGSGFPDLVVGWRGRTELLEVKNPDARVRNTGGRAMSRTRELQAGFRRKWRGRPVRIVTSLDEAVRILTEGRER